MTVLAHTLGAAPGPSSAQRAGLVPGAKRWANRLVGIVLALALWEVVPFVGLVRQDILPPFHRVASSLVTYLGQGATWTAIGQTLAGWAIGLAIASVAGVVVGLAIGNVRVVRELTESTIEFLRPIPSVVLIPLVVLQYGTAIRSEIVLIVYACFWQMLIQVLYGVRDVDPIVRETATSYRLNLWRRTYYMLWPSVAPFAMTGLRLGATIALVIEVTAEMVIGGRGLGTLLFGAQAGDDMPKLYAVAIITGVLGVVINLGAKWLERVVMPWHFSVRGGAE